MTESNHEVGSLSGLTDQEAQEFHALFMKGFFIFTLIAIIAHFLVWSWRPWLPGPEGYTSSLDVMPDYLADPLATTVLAQVSTLTTLIGA